MKPIAVGDLVQVVHECCARHGFETPRTGAVFRVERIASHAGRCRTSGESWSGAFLGTGDNGDGAPMAWCKRIPPLDELEGVKTEETLKETA